jgi:5-methylcytosine-specific restriction protein B
VIDEINRGNVSGIFGELITLLEPDKRMSREEEISVELPYSKEQFTVPPNVYIIGTMNTADRSVEALDTALRRRFAFEEIIPKPELLKDITFNGFNLKEVLATINERIEALVDRDHTIGHSYFINIESGVAEALKHAFENKVIPLLQEYFYNDYEKIALVLGEGFVEKKKSDITFAYPGIEAPEIVESYKLKNVNDIENAVHILLNKKSEESK